MLILITNGTYGHTPTLPNGKKSQYIVPVSRKTGPVDVDPDEAARLVEAGVAEYVTDELVTETETAPAEEESTEKTVTGHLDGTDLETMTVNDLKALANDMGIDTSKLKKKADLIEAISAVEISAPAEEEAPELDAQDVVD